MRYFARATAALSAVVAMACSGGAADLAPIPDGGVDDFANACFALEGAEPGGKRPRLLAPTRDGDGYAFSERRIEDAARLFMKPADLGVYLFYDEAEHYLVSDDSGALMRREELLSDVLTVDDSFESGAEWALEESVMAPGRFQLRHLQSGRYLGVGGLVDDAEAAAIVTPVPTDGCAEVPELTVDAEGEVDASRWDDGSVYGFADTHSHILSNFSFGGGGVFHGAPFHRLGVEHALPDCDLFHGFEGRKDILGYAFDSGARGTDLDQDALIGALASGMVSELNHHTAGYPTFTGWPNAHFRSTHQAQYYKWLERAWLGGLRLVVQHATSNQTICELMAGGDIQPVRYSCNDMVAIDRIIEETHAMERYIDAQEGGPGEGWFRIVTSPEQARAVIDEGKMAVVLGIEVSNLFDCFLSPPPGAPTCNEDYVVEQLDRYHDMGVRAIFPVHKYDNAFSGGDGNRGVIELGNFFQTGHWSNFTEDCPTGVPNVFDKGAVVFGGINMPRDDYDAPPPNDVSGFGDDPVDVALDYVDFLSAGPLEGDYCQNHGLTPLGEHLMEQLMRRGMIIEIDHMNQRAYQRGFEVLEEADYPAAGTHGLHNDGALYALGGVSKTGLGRCQDPDEPGTMDDSLEGRVALKREMGGFPAEGFGFDLGGFAGAPGPRFGPDSVCSAPQEDPVTYPFESYRGDVTFHEPQLGERTVDFNTEGLVHIGLVPELIEDARRDGVTAEDLEPLFKSAEAYIRMWERAERRAAELRGE